MSTVTALDTLQTVRQRPAFIEHGVRCALIEALTWRLGGGAAPAGQAFQCAAVAAAQRRASHFETRGAARLELAMVTQRAAARFFSSPLGRRLMSVPRARIVRAPFSAGGADAGVRDAAGRLHLIGLTALHHPLELGELARRIAAHTEIAPREALVPPQLHLYALPTGTRHVYRHWPGSQASDYRLSRAV